MVAATLLPGVLAVTIAHGQEKNELPIALRPERQTDEWAQSWWLPRHEQKLKEKQELGKVDLLWIGDSITHGWENEGKPVWDENYASYKALNLGFSGDRTEQVLWRFENHEIDDIAPKAIVVMIGTNNTGHRQDPEDQTAAGVAEIVHQLRTRLPDSKILLLAIFPRGEKKDDSLRTLNNAINTKLKDLNDNKHVYFLDIGEKFLDKEGNLPKEIMPDALHPNKRGYEIWAEAIAPTLKKLLGE